VFKSISIFCFQIHKKLRTKALVLELLAAICLVGGGHEIILNAFDNFKREMNEVRRFEVLMAYFINPESFQVNRFSNFYCLLSSYLSWGC